MGCCCCKKKKKPPQKPTTETPAAKTLGPQQQQSRPQTPMSAAVSSQQQQGRPQTPLSAGGVSQYASQVSSQQQGRPQSPLEPGGVYTGRALPHASTKPPEIIVETPPSETKPERKPKGRSMKSSIESKSSKPPASDDGKSSVSAKTPNSTEIESICRATTFTGAEIKTWFRTFKQSYPKGKVHPEQFRDELRKLYNDCDEQLFSNFMFRAFDKNRDGTIDYREFITGLSMATGDNPDDKLRLAFEIYDIDGNGAITRDEIFHVFTSLQKLSDANPKHTPRQRADKIFKVAKKNKDGTITLEEFMKACKTDKLLRKELTALASYK